MAKAKKSKAKKSKAKKSKAAKFRPLKSKATKAKAKAIRTKKSAKKKTPAAKKKIKKAARPAAKAVKAKKSIKKKKTRIVGEGDYAASRAFLKDQSGFVKRNESRISQMGKDAEAALDGPEGDSLREAEAKAQARSRDTF